MFLPFCGAMMGALLGPATGSGVLGAGVAIGVIFGMFLLRGVRGAGEVMGPGELEDSVILWSVAVALAGPVRISGVGVGWGLEDSVMLSSSGSVVLLPSPGIGGGRTLSG